MGLSDESIDRAWTAGLTFHPGLSLARAEFADFVKDCEGLDGARAADLYLACACLSRRPQAIETFVSSYLARVPAYLRRRVPASIVEDVRQQLAELMLVGDAEKPPLLATYRGRGSLEGFVRVVAARLAADLQQHAERGLRSGDAAFERDLVRDEEELKILKEIYREPFRQGFAAGLANLDGESRSLLRLHYAEGVTTAQLARQHRVGRATIVRRLAEARVALVERVQDEVRRTLGVDKEEVESVLRLVRSQLDLSLARLLGAV